MWLPGAGIVQLNRFAIYYSQNIVSLSRIAHYILKESKLNGLLNRRDIKRSKKNVIKIVSSQHTLFSQNLNILATTHLLKVYLGV